jgi:hypothetical protein
MLDPDSMNPDQINAGIYVDFLFLVNFQTAKNGSRSTILLARTTFAADTMTDRTHGGLVS